MSAVAPSTSQRPLKMRVMRSVFRVVNVPMRFVLGLPVSTPLAKRLMLVHLTGRRSGRRYRQPISFVRDGETLLTPGGGQWKFNLVGGQPTRVTLGGRDISLLPELVRDPAEVARLLDAMRAKNPAITRFVPIATVADGTYDRDAVSRAVEHGFLIVRWTPAHRASNQRRRP